MVINKIMVCTYLVWVDINFPTEVNVCLHMHQAEMDGKFSSTQITKCIHPCMFVYRVEALSTSRRMGPTPIFVYLLRNYMAQTTSVLIDMADPHRLWTQLWWGSRNVKFCWYPRWNHFEPEWMLLIDYPEHQRSIIWNQDRYASWKGQGNHKINIIGYDHIQWQ